MSPNSKSLEILTPMYGGMLTVNYHHSFLQLSAACKAAEIELSSQDIWNESLISRARNRLVDTFLKEGTATHACFIDADIGFDARDVIMMLEMDKPIMGVACSKKSINWGRIQHAIARQVLDWSKNNPACRNGFDSHELALQFRDSQHAFQPADIPRIGGDFVLNLLEDTANIKLDTPEAMKRLGTGLLMVKREVFEKFRLCYPNRYYESRGEPGTNPGKIHDFFKVGINPESRVYDSEDYWFIHDCIAIGYQALLCPWVKTTHMGTYTFVGDLQAALECAGTIF